MSQLSWTLLDDFGQQYEIGLYHGDRTKHVLIHINKRPIVVDFNIKDPKQYSFYVGYELCEMKIEKETDQYSYSFVTNQDADTPLNLARRHQSRKYFIFIIIIAVVLMLSILALSYWMMTTTPFWH